MDQYSMNRDSIERKKKRERDNAFKLDPRKMMRSNET